jgi:hypothetical protein
MNSFGCSTKRARSSSGNRCTLPYPPRTATSADTNGSVQCLMNADART